MTINDSGRKKLTIVKLLEKRKVGEAEVQEFTAVVGEPGKDNPSAKYGVWVRSLDEYIKPDATIDCDVVVKTSEKLDPDGNPYQNRKVTQIYMDGQPVGIAKKQFGGGFSQQDSPEKRRSIERQTALTLAVDWTKFTIDKTGKAMSGDPLSCANTFYQWISQRTIPPQVPSSTSEKPQTQGAKAFPTSTPSTATKEDLYGPKPAPASDSHTEAPKPPASDKKVVYKTDPATIKDKTAFQKVCRSDFNLNEPREITKELGVNSLLDIKDYGDAYQQIAAARG